MKNTTHTGPRKHKNIGRLEREHPPWRVSGLLPICLAEKSDCVTNSLLKTTEIQILEKVPDLKPPWEQFLGQQQQQWQRHSVSLLVPSAAQPAAFQPGDSGSGEDWLHRQGDQGCRLLWKTWTPSVPTAICRIPSAGPLALQRVWVWDSPWLQCLPQLRSPKSTASNILSAPGAVPQLPEGFTEPLLSPLAPAPQSPPGIREGVQANSELSHWNSCFQ